MSEIEMIEVDAVEYRRVMDENKRLKKIYEASLSDVDLDAWESLQKEVE